MGIIADFTDDKCENCAASSEDADLYRCDNCQEIYCQDCAPHRDDDAPIDVCQGCIEGSE